MSLSGRVWTEQEIQPAGRVSGRLVRNSRVAGQRGAQEPELDEAEVSVGFHFTPTLDSRVNAIEGFFPKLSRQRLKNAVFNSVDECIAAVESCIEHQNGHDARPFRWSRKPGDLLEAWKKGHQKLQE